MVGIKRKPRITTSLAIPREIYDLCDEHDIMFIEAFRVGVGIILAEKGVKDYDSNLNLFRRLEKLRIELEKKCIELEALRESIQMKRE